MKKIYNFPEKSELPEFILPVKISWLIFSAVSGMEIKNLQRSEQAHFGPRFKTRMALGSTCNGLPNGGHIPVPRVQLFLM